MDENQNDVLSEPQVQLSSKMFTFFGSYDHSIDAKGRIVVPNAYRAPLGDSFVISITRDTRGIAIYPNDVFEDLLKEISSLNRRKVSVQEYTSKIAKYSFINCQLDNQGRLLLPSKLRQAMLGDAKDIEISGAFDHVEIVSTELAAMNDKHFNDHIDEILEEIGNM